MAPPRASTRRLMASSELSSRARVVPTAWAAAAAVRSSVVGPSPPVQMTKRLAAPRRRRASTMRGISSGTSSTVATTKPAPVSVAASHDALVFTISPRVSSVPMERMATVIVFSLARGFLQCCGEKGKRTRHPPFPRPFAASSKALRSASRVTSILPREVRRMFAVGFGRMASASERR
jgi:hypothetical protein